MAKSVDAADLKSAGRKAMPVRFRLRAPNAERNKVRAAYNRAQYMAERKKMMGAWADYLDGLRADTGKVVAFRRKGS